MDTSLTNTLVSTSMLQKTVSRSDGLSQEFETKLKVLGCDLLERMGILLKLPQVAMATAQVLLHRFYFTSSLKEFCLQDVVLGCLFLASKIEEFPRKVNDIINVYWFLVCSKRGAKNLHFKYAGEFFYDCKDGMFEVEKQVLSKLGFNVQVHHPHSFLINYLRSLNLSENYELSQLSWNYMNDCLRTNVVVCYQPSSIACSVIYLACRILKIKLPTNPPWWEVYDVFEGDLIDISKHILALYEIEIDYSLPLTVSEFNEYTSVTYSTTPYNDIKRGEKKYTSTKKNLNLTENKHNHFTYERQGRSSKDINRQWSGSREQNMVYNDERKRRRSSSKGRVENYRR
ncbi:Cyclin-L1 [Lobulomyces angularis]|nr:Cyclin-L1 [Lobulomyces angularis]